MATRREHTRRGLGRAQVRGVYAPKGQDEKAQGNALGHATTV